MDYPVFNVEVETTNDGVWAISLVDAPAVDSEFLLFSKQEKPEKQFNFSIENEEKHNILGCVLRADYPIYRYDSERGEYYLNFSKEVIEKMTAKMLKLGTFKNVDLNHDENYDVEGMSLLQMFIKDSEKGINPVGFEDVADGSLFAVYHVDSFDLWNEIKEGKFNGFSVEAFLTIYEQFNKNNEKPVEEVASEETAEEIDVEVELDENEDNASEEIEETTEEENTEEIEETEEQTEENNNIVEEDSPIVEAIKEAFSAHNVVETEEGVKIYYVDDEIAVGSKLTDESGNAIGNGEYTINGKTYKVEDGQVTEIIETTDEESNEEPADTVEETASEETTDVEETTEETTEPAEEQPEETETVEETTDDITTEQDNTEIATLKATIETLKAEIEALKAEITKPAAPTVEEFSRSGNKGESKAESMLDYLYSIRKH